MKQLLIILCLAATCFTAQAATSTKKATSQKETIIHQVYVFIFTEKCSDGTIYFRVDVWSFPSNPADDISVKSVSFGNECLPF